MKSLFIILLLLINVKAKCPPLSSEGIQCESLRGCDFTTWETSTFNEIMLLRALSDLVEHPEIVYAQAILETGSFSSNIFKENNNLFGMKTPRVRPTTAIGTHRGHAKYKSWQDSVRDYALWQEYYKSKGYDITKYDIFLKKFNSKPSYINRVKYIVKLK